MSSIDPGTSTWLRARNDRTAFRLLLEHGPLTRARLGELSGMSKPTATQMLTRLERAELVGPVGAVSGSRGPTAVSYGVLTDRVTGVAVSMQAHSLQAVLVDATDTAYPTVRLRLDPAQRSPEADIRAAIEAACAAAGAQAEAVAVVAVGVQAAVWREGDRLSLTDTLPGWPTVGSRSRIEQALGRTAILENDVNLATMAERASGAAQEASSFALLWLGDGLGVGVDLGGIIHRGASGSAGEIGYLRVAERSGDAAPRASARGEHSRPDTTDLLGSPAILDLLGLAEGADYSEHVSRISGNTAAITAIADRVALALEPVLAVLDPAMVVLGGPTSLAAGPELTRLVGEHLSREHHTELTVALSDTGETSVLLGARQFLVEEIRERLEARIPVGTSTTTVIETEDLL